MILSWGDQGTADIFNGQSSAASRNVPPANRLEKLSGQWAGYYSIRINDQWRVVFSWSSNHAENVHIVDYH